MATLTQFELDSSSAENLSKESSARDGLDKILSEAYGPQAVQGKQENDVVLAVFDPPKIENTKASNDKIVEDLIRERDKPINFSDNLYESYKKAVASGKPLIVQFSQPSCGVCQKLSKDTYDSKQVRLLEPYAEWAKIDPVLDEDDKGNVGALLKRLGIDRVPATVIIDVSGGKLDAVRTIMGYHGPKEFSKYIFETLCDIEKNKKPNNPI